MLAQSAGAVEYSEGIAAVGVRPLPQRMSWSDIKESDGDVPALEIWGMRSTSSTPLLPGPLWPGVLVPDRRLSMGQIELNWAYKWLILNCYCYKEILETI